MPTYLLLSAICEGVQKRREDCPHPSRDRARKMGRGETHHYCQDDTRVRALSILSDDRACLPSRWHSGDVINLPRPTARASDVRCLCSWPMPCSRTWQMANSSAGACRSITYRKWHFDAAVLAAGRNSHMQPVEPSLSLRRLALDAISAALRHRFSRCLQCECFV